MSKCNICEMIASKKDVIAESGDVVVMLAPNPAVDGHIIVTPKQHAPIIEQVHDQTIGDLFSAANKVATGLFDAIGAQGTNILVQNGLAAGQNLNHVVINVLPRKENDGLNLEWQPKKLNDEEMNHIEFTLKEEAKHIGKIQQAPKKPLSLDEPQPTSDQPDQQNTQESTQDTPPEENYELKQLRRIP